MLLKRPKARARRRRSTPLAPTQSEEKKQTTTVTKLADSSTWRLLDHTALIRPNPVGPKTRGAMKLILYLGALQPLSNWLDYIPARLGHDAAVDDAALAFVSALDFYYSDRTALAASAAASRHYTTALTSLRTLIDSPGKTCTDDTIVCVALLTFHPLLMYGPGDKRRKDVFAHQSGLKAIFSAVYGASPPSAIAQYIMYSLVETLSVDPVVHDAAAPSLGDDALWPSMNHPASLGRIRQETFSLKQITYRLRVQTSRLNNYVIRLRTGGTSPVLLATAIALCQRVAVLKDDELESEILHRVHVVRNRDPCTRALTAISFEFVEVEDLITCVHYWCNRLKAINLCLKVLDLARDDDHRPLQLDRTAMRDDKHRLFRNLVMSWHHASALGAWATLGVARGLMQVWQAIREGSLLPSPGVSTALEWWVAERILHPFHTWFPSSGAVEELDQAADMLVGGGCPGWLGYDAIRGVPERGSPGGSWAAVLSERWVTGSSRPTTKAVLASSSEVAGSEAHYVAGMRLASTGPLQSSAIDGRHCPANGALLSPVEPSRSKLTSHTHFTYPQRSLPTQCHPRPALAQVKQRRCPTIHGRHRPGQSIMAPLAKRQKFSDRTRDDATPTNTPADKAGAKAPVEQDGVAETKTRDTPAADAVIATAELLENILLKIDAKTLLLSQRTAHRFRAVVQGSAPLQKKLVLKPVATLKEALHLADGEDFDEACVRASEDADEDEEHGVLNPLLFVRREVNAFDEACCRIPGRAKSTDSSWWEMILVSPSPTALRVDWGCGMHVCSGGMTLGQCLEHAEDLFLMMSRDQMSFGFAGKPLAIDGDVVSIASFLDSGYYNRSGPERLEGEEEVEDGWREWPEMTGFGPEWHSPSEETESLSEGSGREEDSRKGHESGDGDLDNARREDNERGTEAESGD
ncbi:hypothetical protein LTR53_007655 [Teratosphaeriaceae sp. CCFEE 6253]|nr:hypothetical protein LTR53_007655 [Teratosphaeriaceae sp. CCFEE 6253]